MAQTASQSHHMLPIGWGVIFLFLPLARVQARQMSFRNSSFPTPRFPRFVVFRGNLSGRSVVRFKDRMVYETEGPSFIGRTTLSRIPSIDNCTMNALRPR
jgi:hypothetical protein